MTDQTAPIREARIDATIALAIAARDGDDTAAAQLAQRSAEGLETDGVTRWIDEAIEQADAIDETGDADEQAEYRRQSHRAWQRALALLRAQAQRAANAQA